MSKKLLGISIILLAAVICSPAVLGQGTTGAIFGTVQDSTGAVLPGAEVTVTQVETGRSRVIISDDEGRYRAQSLNIGNYEVTASLPGFQTSVRSGISLTIGREAVVDFTLSIGEITERVTVTSEASLVATTSGSLGSLVDRQTVLELPLNGRDMTVLLTLQAGVVNPRTNNTGTSSGFSQQISISGARPHDNSILLDGTEVKGMDQSVPAGMSGNFIGSEAIQEFKIERNSYSAQFGGASGGVINVVSKAGTNEFHGSIYEFHRNDVLDAAEFRAATIVDSSGAFAGKDKQPFIRNQFGFSVGGPIIPNKTFFFGNYEGLRDRLSSTGFMTTFTDAKRLDPTIDPEVLPYLELWPRAGSLGVDLGDGRSREPIGRSQPTNENFYQVRIDHNISDADSIFARVTRQTSNRIRTENIPVWSHDNFANNLFFTLEEKKIFSPQVLNSFRVGFNRRGIGEFSSETPEQNPSLRFVPDEFWRSPLGAPPVVGRINISGMSGVGLSRGWVDRKVNSFEFLDDVIYNRGPHSLKFGATIRRIHLNGQNPSRIGGEFAFSDIDDFLAGEPNRFRGDIQPTSDSTRGIRYWIAGWYIQDDWQVTPHLNLNMGFRHEFYTVPYEVNGKTANLKNPLTDTSITLLDQAVDSAGAPLGGGRLGNDWFENPSFKSFMPRLGLAWDPTGSGMTAVRAGFGIFYNHIQSEVFRQASFRTQPFLIETNIRGSGNDIPFPNIYDPVVNQGLGQGDMHLFPYDWAKNPHMLQWNLNVQQEIFNQTAVTVGYAGARGISLQTSINLNQPLTHEVIDGRVTFPDDAVVANPFWEIDLQTRAQAADSYYNSLQMGLQRRFRDGWQLQVSYTFSKTQDTSSQTNPTFGNEGGGIVYTYLPHMRKSLAAFHLANSFSSSAVWQLPFGSGKPFGSNWTGLMDKILGGWQLSTIVTIADGSPDSIEESESSFLSNLSIETNTPDEASGGSNNPVLGDPDLYFDPAAFESVCTSSTCDRDQTFGKVGRNTLIIPGLANVDLSFTKKTGIGENVSVQFRAEMFNIFNRPNFEGPSVRVFRTRSRTDSSAGFIGGTIVPMRQVQFGLRIVF